MKIYCVEIVRWWLRWQPETRKAYDIVVGEQEHIPEKRYLQSKMIRTQFKC